MPDQKVHVYESSDNEYRVEPPLIEVKAVTDTMKVRNHSNDDMVFYVIGGAFLASNPVIVALPPKKLTTIGTPVTQATTGTLYTYQIINPKNGKKAKGNSDPVLIVEN